MTTYKKDERTRVSIDGVNRTDDGSSEPRWGWDCPACDEPVRSVSPAAAIKKATTHAKCCTEYGPEHNWQPGPSQRAGVEARAESGEGD